MFLAFGFLFIISIFLIFGWHGDYRLAGFVCLFLAVGGMYLSDHLWDDHPTKKLITIYITTSKGEIPLHMWNWTEPLEGSFDVRWKEQNAHEERCKQIVDAIRRAIEVG